MAHLKASRGFFPVVALTDGGGSAAGSPMSQGPRPPKAKGRGKSKSKTKSKNKTNTWVNKEGQIPQRANATRCLKCGQVGHWAAHCPQNSPSKSTTRQSPTSSPTSTSPSKKAKGNDGSAMMVRDMAKQGPRGVPHLGLCGWFGLQDGGASSVVCGHDVLMRIVDYMSGRDISPDRFLFAGLLVLEVTLRDKLTGQSAYQSTLVEGLATWNALRSKVTRRSWSEGRSCRP